MCTKNKFLVFLTMVSMVLVSCSSRAAAQGFYPFEGEMTLADAAVLELSDQKSLLEYGFTAGECTQVMVQLGLDPVSLHEGAKITVGSEVLSLAPHGDEYGAHNLMVITDSQDEVIVDGFFLPYYYCMPKTVGVVYFEDWMEKTREEFPSGLHTTYVVYIHGGEIIPFGKLSPQDGNMSFWDGVFD